MTKFMLSSIFSVVTRVFMSRQVLPDVDIQLKILVATLSLFVSADLLHSSHVLSRHVVFYRDIAPFLHLVLCVATEEILS